MAANARHAPRPWRTSPPFDGLQAELPAGSTMDHPLLGVIAWFFRRPGPLSADGSEVIFFRLRRVRPASR